MPSLPIALAALLAAAPSPPPEPAAAAKAGAESAGSEWFSYFYVHQRADLLGAMVARLDRDGVFAREGASRPLSAFLSVAFRRPDVRAEELVASAEVSRPAREALLDGLWLAGNGAAAGRLARAAGLPVERYAQPPPDLRTMALDDPGALDMLWGAFLASGDVAYPRRIVDLLDGKEASAATGALRVALLGSARWSLSSNARQHEPVLRLVREEQPRRSGPARIVLERIVRDADAAAGTVGRMTKVVTRLVSPAPPQGSFASKPRTLYRLGERWGRLEEEPDPGQGIHQLVVVAEPDVWMVNRMDGTGRHVVDPGPTFVFHVPLIPVEPGATPKPPLLELGDEYAFLRAHGATRSKAGKLERWQVHVGGFSVTLDGDPGKERARRIRIARDGGDAFELEYLEYARDLAPRLELFRPPEGIQIEEAAGTASP